jgi:hypothetical protein
MCVREIHEDGNRTKRKKSGPKREDVIKDGRRLHNKEFHNFHFLPVLSGRANKRRIRWMANVKQT